MINGIETIVSPEEYLTVRIPFNYPPYIMISKPTIFNKKSVMVGLMGESFYVPRH